MSINAECPEHEEMHNCLEGMLEATLGSNSVTSNTVKDGLVLHPTHVTLG